jgi:outer membrane biogenesis lipoprotein LolB
MSETQGGPMKSRIALLAAALLFAGSAWAFHCPTDMKKIDDALAKNPQLTPAQLEEVKKYRAEGEALHKAGKHQESLDTLAKAEKILGIPTN